MTGISTLACRMLACLVFVASSADAQTKTRVAVTHTGSDPVGIQLAYAIREEVRRSAAYELGTDDNYLFAIRFATLDAAGEEKGISAAVAVAFTMFNYQPYKAGDPQTWMPIFLDGYVFVVGRNRTESVAKQIIADLDRGVESFKAQVKR